MPSVKMSRNVYVSVVGTEIKQKYMYNERTKQYEQILERDKIYKQKLESDMMKDLT